MINNKKYFVAIGLLASKGSQAEREVGDIKTEEFITLQILFGSVSLLLRTYCIKTAVYYYYYYYGNGLIQENKVNLSLVTVLHTAPSPPSLVLIPVRLLFLYM